MHSNVPDTNCQESTEIYFRLACAGNRRVNSHREQPGNNRFIASEVIKRLWRLCRMPEEWQTVNRRNHRYKNIVGVSRRVTTCL